MVAKRVSEEMDKCHQKTETVREALSVSQDMKQAVTVKPNVSELLEGHLRRRRRLHLPMVQ